MKTYSITNNYKDGSSVTNWYVGGKYHVVHYDYRSSGSFTEKRSTFCAYYIPAGYPNWGEYVDRSTSSYNTFDEAVQACHKFDSTSGDKANFKKASAQ